jgi:hypothetical protein
MSRLQKGPSRSKTDTKKERTRVKGTATKEPCRAPMPWLSQRSILGMEF